MRSPWLVAALAVTVAACTRAPRPTRAGDSSAATWSEVDNATIEARLTSPPTQFPSDDTRTRIARDDGGPLAVSLRLCVAASGANALVEVIAASGDPDFDAAAVEATRRWRFSAGADQCTIISIRYSQRREL